MTHWYGWLALAVVILLGLTDASAVVRHAWHGPKRGPHTFMPSPLWVAAWATLAIAMVLA